MKAVFTSLGVFLPLLALVSAADDDGDWHKVTCPSLECLDENSDPDFIAKMDSEDQCYKISTDKIDEPIFARECFD